MKILEGTGGQRAAPGRKKTSSSRIYPIDTTNILFICGGAFDGIDKIIQNRIGSKTMGFGAEIKGTG